MANCNDYDDEDVFDSDTPTVVNTNQEAEEPGEQRNQTRQQVSDQRKTKIRSKRDANYI